VSARTQRGATLIEALAYLTVAAVITAGVLSLFGSGFGSSETTRLAVEVTALANNVRDLYASQNTYASVSVAGLVQAKAVPPTLAVSGSGASATLSDIWGGAVTVGPYTTASQAEVQYAGVPQDICRRVLVAGGNWLDIVVNSTSLNTGAPDLSEANTACDNATGNTIEWVFQ
jgi:type II secretory pathway pseudopilin PulG